MPQLVIAPKGEKGRSFAAELLAAIEVDHLWEYGRTTTDVRRPVWMVVASSEQNMRAFHANLLTGKRAETVSNNSTKERWELVPSAGYAHHSRRIGNSVVTTYFLPELLRLDPGMVDPVNIRFMAIPAKAWVDSQSFDLPAARARLLQLADVTPAAILESQKRWEQAGERLSVVLSDEALHLLLCEGSLMLAYLDRRCRYPIPFDPVFGAWLNLVCREDQLLMRPTNLYRGGFRTVTPENVNAFPGFAFMSSHDTFGTTLSREVRRWFNTTGVPNRALSRTRGEGVNGQA